MSEDTSDRTAPGRPPLSLSPAIPRILLILALAGIFVGLWPHTYWENRNADGWQEYYSKWVEVSRVDLALRAVGVRRFAENSGRLPVDLAECLTVTPTLQEWLSWAGELPYRDDRSNDPKRIAIRFDEPWAPRYARYYRESDPPPPVPDPDLDVVGLPMTYDHSEPFEPPEFSILSSDPLPSVVLEYLDSHGGVPADAPQPFSLTSPTLAQNMGEVRSAQWRRVWAWVILLGGFSVWILACIAVRRVWRGHESGRAGRVTVKVMSVITGLAAIVGLLGTCATCYAPGHFSTRRLTKEKRLGFLDAAVREGKVRKDVAERARRYIRELP